MKIFYSKQCFIVINFETYFNNVTTCVGLIELTCWQRLVLTTPYERSYIAISCFTGWTKIVQWT